MKIKQTLREVWRTDIAIKALFWAGRVAEVLSYLANGYKKIHAYI